MVQMKKKENQKHLTSLLRRVSTQRINMEIVYYELFRLCVVTVGMLFRMSQQKYWYLYSMTYNYIVILKLSTVITFLLSGIFSNIRTMKI